jgi:flagellar P-ring protein precursor FlgI
MPTRARSGRVSGRPRNQLTGYGIVVGLAGTGDDNLEYLTQAMKGTAGRLGVQLPPGVSPGLKNAAAVLITADLPAFAKPGQRIDVTVSTLGKAKSLRGGALIMTPLYGADGRSMRWRRATWLSAAWASPRTVRSHREHSHRRPHRRGASVERAVATGFDDNPILRWNLFAPIS